MTDFQKNLSTLDERVERLICRSLDGEITADEQAEFDTILASDPEALALFVDYRRNDFAAAQALQREARNAMTAVVARPRRGLWLATAGAVLSAAAVVVFSFVSHLLTSGTAITSNDSTKPGIMRSSPVIEQPTYVDYNNAADYMPLHRQRNLQRDLIGIPGPNKDVIYILERNVRSTRLTPISGDF